MTNIRKTLERSGDFAADKTQVITRGTKVILNGTIRSRLEKQAVERVTWLTPGVSMVDNHLIINSSKI
ncbi:BON domain-containing protein [Mucilaginibacter sp.]|uniref:BON domain-containing protein n=1 Tax=Mucilaginibacter sp. TaxID=1882438 RepID=UPI003263CA70